MTARTDAAQRLLDIAIAQLAEHGASNLSLRQLAARIGTSHRMLIYHFGSKEGLFTAVVQAMEARQHQLLDQLSLSPDASPDEVARTFWHQLRDSELRPYIRLFFEMYGQAVRDQPGTQDMLDGIVEMWTEPLAAFGVRHGLPEATARSYARLGLAVTRGLLLDLLATGDEAAVDDAMETFIATYSQALRGAVTP
ncbi:MAG: TetR/AcrR family transcriptional regulator [Streptosporangiales bacterium]